MQLIEIPNFPRLRGQKAIDVISDFMNELEGGRGKELTEKQTATLIKLAKGLISSIEAEICAPARVKETRKALKKRCALWILRL